MKFSHLLCFLQKNRSLDHRLRTRAFCRAHRSADLRCIPRKNSQLFKGFYKRITGFFETRASFASNSALIRLDFPTFDLPLRKSDAGFRKQGNYLLKWPKNVKIEFLSHFSCFFHVFYFFRVFYVDLVVFQLVYKEFLDSCGVRFVFALFLSDFKRGFSRDLFSRNMRKNRKKRENVARIIKVGTFQLAIDHRKENIASARKGIIRRFLKKNVKKTPKSINFEHISWFLSQIFNFRYFSFNNFFL